MGHLEPFLFLGDRSAFPARPAEIFEQGGPAAAAPALEGLFQQGRVAFHIGLAILAERLI